MKTINVIGCGNVGKALSRLWTQHRVFKLQAILNRSLPSATAAVDFIGSGCAVEDYAQLKKAAVVMISASDESIEECCRKLCGANVLEEGTVVFHCSGSLSSAVLEPAKRQGALIASIHPVMSFAEPSAAVETFAGTFCAIEGDRQACDVVRDALHRCGAKTFHVEPEFKTVYHAATVMVCNYLVALMEVGLRCFEKAGLARETALELMEPIVRGTVSNVFRLGPVRALSGPIARGEVSVVQRQCEALDRWDEDIRQIYKNLGRVAAQLSAAQGNATPDTLAAIERMLRG